MTKSIDASPWTFENPVKVTFGAGRLNEIGKFVAGRRYILVTYAERLFHLLAGRIAEWAGPPLAIVDGVKPNPDFAVLEEPCARTRDLPIDVIVAVGGGSVIDTAKVIAAAGGEFELVRRYLEFPQSAALPKILPIIAVPTTAGTGSEVTCWATLWDERHGRKWSLAHPQLYPEFALVDPMLTYEAPRTLTVTTALDALSHALESIWNRNANPVSRSLATAAAREIVDVLPCLVSNLDDHGLRGRMAQAALLAGLAFSNTKTALAHSISYDVTLLYGVPHGIACSFSLPLVMRAAIGHDRACDRQLAAIFGPDLDRGCEELSQFLQGLGVSVSPIHYGIDPSSWQAIVEKAQSGERGRNFIGSIASVCRL